MKKTTLLSLILAIALVIVSGRSIANSITGKSGDRADKETVAKEATPAPDGRFKAFEVETEFNNNPFTLGRKPLLLMAGDEKTGTNAMTIGWGAAGVLWRVPAITVYVAPARYTFQFMEKTKYFTVMKIGDSVLEYMGTHSGRDGDKAKALGLHVAYTEHGAPYYTEATEVYECEMMYAAPFEAKNFKNHVPKDMYRSFPPGIHSMYIGRVTGAWRK